MAKKEEKNMTDKDKNMTGKASKSGKIPKETDMNTPPLSGDVKGPRSSSDRSMEKNPGLNEDNSVTRSGKIKNVKGKGEKAEKKSGSEDDDFLTDDMKMPSATGDEKGLSAKRKAATTAKDKYPYSVEKAAKEGNLNFDTEARSTENKGSKKQPLTSNTAEENKKLPKPKKALPKKTASSKKADNEDASSDTDSTGLRASRATKPVQDTKIKKDKPKTVAPKSSTADKKTTGMAAEIPKKSKSSKEPPTTVVRKRKVASKREDSSIVDDLKDLAIGAAKKLADKVLPDEETQQDIIDTAKDILPNQEDIAKTTKDLKDKFAPDAEKVNKIADKIIPEKKEKANSGKSRTDDATEKIMDRNYKKAAENKFNEISLFSEYDVHLFKEGKHFHLYKKFGSHPMDLKGQKGTYFALWAPNAEQVSVIGDFNEWYRQGNPMQPRQDGSGIWEAFIPEAKSGSIYKYFIRSTNGYEVEKGDPFAFLWETPPETASVVWDLESSWNDDKWMKSRKTKAGKSQPVSVYEMHIGSWRRVPEDNMRSLTYRELAEELPGYLKNLGFTHVEFMPVMEHPFFGSWGYQVTGYFAPSSRFGTPQDFMYLIDTLHREGIGVILDWVPSHFPSDMHGLHYFDGTFLYEHADPRKGFHPDWKSYIFNFGRNEVRSFLISNSLFWLDLFHADGLRVDAVASMLYLDYSRKHGEWEPNEHGGNENLEAISFIKEFNEVVYGQFPDVMTIAEESTAWPMVSRPTYMGGLGFGMKWMMGWMHDTLEYFQNDPIHRKHHQNTITFSTNYAFTENFMLPLSHDEVVYGKQALINKMPGDAWNKFANLRALYAYMYAHPGTKLLFMGGEFAQTTEWNHDSSLDWHVTEEDGYHRRMQETIKALNNLYQSEPALYENSFDAEGFEWIDFNDAESSVMSFLRKGKDPKDTILVVCNLTPVARENYRIGVPAEGNWKEIFNSDNAIFGGSDVKNDPIIKSEALSTHMKDNSVVLRLPPMSVMFFKKEV